MKIVVLKFGGTSVADVPQIKKIALKIKLEVELGYKVITVVSAMSGVTNNLINLVKNTSDIPPYSEYDTVLSTGEQVTSALLAIALDELKIKARSWLGWQIPIVTDNTYGKSVIEKIKTDKDDVSAAANDYLKTLGFVSVAYAWIKVLDVSFKDYNENKKFYDDKINTAKFYFDKVLPRAEQHYKSAISGSSNIMNFKFN